LLPNRQDLFRVGRQAIVTAPSTRINPAVVDVPGSDANLIVGSQSLMGEEIVSHLANCMRGLFVDTARDEQLDRKAYDLTGLTRFPAVPARVDLTILRLVAGAGGTIPAGLRVQTAGGTQFALDDDVVFLAADTSKAAAATALVTGPDGNVPANVPAGIGVVQFADQPFDATMTVTNAAGAAGGSDSETDVDFRGRIRAFFPTVRRGVLGAIDFAALQVPGIVVATAFEIVNPAPNSMPAAAVQLVVGDKNGLATSGMLLDVRDRLIEFRAAGIPVDVISGIVDNELVTWDIDFDSAVNSTRVAEDVRAVTVAVAQFLGPNEILYRSSLIAAAKTVPGAIVGQNSLVVPVGDIVPTTRQTIIRVRSQDVKFT